MECDGGWKEITITNGLEQLEVARCPSQPSLAKSRTADSAGNFALASEGRRPRFVTVCQVSVARGAGQPGTLPLLRDLPPMLPSLGSRYSLVCSSQNTDVITCPEAAERPPTPRPWMPRYPGPLDRFYHAVAGGSGRGSRSGPAEGGTSRVLLVESSKCRGHKSSDESPRGCGSGRRAPKKEVYRRVAQ